MTHSDFAIGLDHMANGRMDQAIDALSRAVTCHPDDVPARHALGMALGKAERVSDAVEQLMQAVSLAPDNADIRGTLIYFLTQAKRWELVLEQLSHLPQDQDCLTDQAVILNTLERYDAAESSARAALELAPDHAKAWSNLGVALKKQNRMDDALICCRKVVELLPTSSEAINLLATHLHDMDKFDEAEQNYRRAIAINPHYAEAFSNLGGLYQDIGKLEQARHFMEIAIELDPHNAISHYNLAAIKRFTKNDPQFLALKELAQNAFSLPVSHQMPLQFALAKAYDDVGERDLGFRHLLHGNALKRSQISYDETTTLALFQRVQQVFTADMLNVPSAPANGPIFILGMPRSGSSLIEQILASHPQITGAGELDLLTQVTEHHCGLGGFPEKIAQLSRADLFRLGADYVAALMTKAPTGIRVTDKLPNNFFFCGLIHLAIPNARIIHTRRDPIDTCLSCFSKLFSDTQNFTYDLGELGRYYRHYDQLMTHWQQVLPPGVMLDVQYEDIVDDLEGQTRRILNHCGLDWDATCLNFHQTERPVRTASATEVRQPIYKTSVQRWRPSAALLSPLTDELKRSSQ